MSSHELKELAELLAPGERIIVGVSGGVDSMVLLDILHRNKEILRKEFKVLHVNHHISPQSGEWAQFVTEYCEARGIPHEVVDVDITKYGKNLEHAARQARYAAFAAQNTDMIVLAHHLNDQCETFFLKLFRGSGLKGLRCMDKSSPSWIDPSVRLVRPLLGWSKEQIQHYADAHGVPNIEDLSNGDTRFDRNWIRHDLWPLIIERNEIADVNVLRSINLLGEAWELTQDLAQIDQKNCVNSDGSLDWIGLRQLNLPRLKNLILHILDQNNIVGFSTHHIEDFAKSLINADMDSKNELRVKGFVMRKIGKKVVHGTDLYYSS